MAKKTVADIDVKGKRVLMRVDFNVPIKDGKVADDNRIVQSLPTIKNVIERGGKLILMSHLGRPKGEKKKELSLRPVAEQLSSLLGQDVMFVDDCIGPQVKQAVDALNEGDILLLENLRFYKEEEANDENFAKELASLGEVYVNDAFGTAHRKHASTYGVPMFISGSKVIGFLIEKELKYLGEALENPVRPFVAILGGAKVSDKIEVINNLLGKVDKLLIGGAMAYTFALANGRKVGNSLVEEDKTDLARELMEKGKDKLVLPVDTVCGREFKEGTEVAVFEGDIPDGWQGFDIGPKTLQNYIEIIKDAKTVLWNGPVGAFEVRPFDKGTIEIAKVLAEITSKGGITIIGGGDSAAAVRKAGLDDKMTHVSTGGGASLEFLSGVPFETIEILDNK